MGEDRTFLLDALSCRSKLQLPAYLWLTLFERGYELHRKTSTEDENAVGRSGITFTIGPDGKATQVVVEISMCAAKELSSGFQIRRRQQVRLADEPCYFSFASDDAKSMTTRPKTFARRKSRSRSDAPSFGFTSSELRTLRALKSPAGIQRFLDQLPYNLSFTARSPQRVLRDRTASCLEGGIFAAAALCVIGFPPLIFDLEAEQDTDHVVAIFKVRGHWGAVAKSNFTGCRYREPVYRNLRELAMSYFNVYFNLRGERTLRRYSRPVNLARFDRLDWMTTEKPIWFIAEHLCEIPHISLLTPPMEKRLTRIDRRTFKGEMVGHRK